MTMLTKAKPPPDTRANLLGRLLLLDQQSHIIAVGGIRVYVEDTPSKPGKSEPTPGSSSPKDYDKALSVAQKTLEPIKQALLKRLESCPVMVVSQNPKKPPKIKPTKETRPKPDNAASAVLSDRASEGPLSREKALSQTAKSSKSLLDFMQSSLD